jgi:hypothetical protein
MSAHRQIPIKVNTYVDEGISSLVMALSQIPEVITFESCEGDDDGAWVYFDYGLDSKNGWKRTARFAHDLAEFLYTQGGDVETDITLTWYGGGRHPYISIQTAPNLINDVANLIYLWRP